MLFLQSPSPVGSKSGLLEGGWAEGSRLLCLGMKGYQGLPTIVNGDQKKG